MTYGTFGYGLEPYGSLVGGSPPIPTSASIAFIQSNHGSSHGAASVVIPLSSLTLPGDTMFASICLPPLVAVSSIIDTINGRWVRSSNATSTGGNAELWYCRGIAHGSASVTVSFSTAASCGVNISEFSNIWFQDPLDTWSQNFGTSGTVAPQTVTPRQNGDLVMTVGCSGAAIGTPTGGYTTLTMDGTGYAAAYDILSGSVAPATSWSTTGTPSWSAIEATFVAGPTGHNPDLQFPETLVQVAIGENFLAPVEGVGVWANISHYVRNMTLGPIGRQHELDRVQAAEGTVTVNNRDGAFNTWNTNSYLVNNHCLDPMTPLSVTAAWLGITSHEYFGYIQSTMPVIGDVLNVDATLSCYDVFQMLSLKYLSGNNYAALVDADGGVNLQAFYRLGDTAGSYAAIDASGNGNTGSLIAGLEGDPLYGAAGPFLYDASGALDLTNGTNVLNGGVTTTNYATSPPTQNNPLASASVWTFETWAKWTSTAAVMHGQSVAFTGSTDNVNLPNYIDNIPNSNPSGGPLPGLAVGDLVTGPNVAVGSTLTGVYTDTVTLSLNTTGAGSGTFYAVAGQVGSTLFSGTTQSGTVDIRVGTFTGASVTYYNRVTAGPVTSVYAPVVFSNNNTTQNGSWHHIAMSYAASVATFFIDGVQDSSANVGNWSSPSVITIGCDAGGANGWVGSLANVALYSASLSAAQAANHYATGMWFQQEEYGASVGGTNAGRFNKVMAVAGLPSSSMLDVPYPFRTLMYAEMNAVTTTSALNYLQTLSETEPGLIYQGADGNIRALSRQYQYLNPKSVTSNATFSDSLSSPNYYDGPSLQIAADDLDTWNDIQVQSGRSGSQLQTWGPGQSPAAAVSASVNGSRTLQGLTSLQQANDADALAIAQNYGAWYNNPINRVTQMTLTSYGSGGNNIPQMLARKLYDRITVGYQGQTSSSPFEQDSLIEQITHTVNVDAGPEWSTSWALSPYEILLEPFLIGTSQGQMSGAASVTGSGSIWIQHATGTPLASGTVTYTVASGATTTVPFNANSAAVTAALDVLVPGTVCVGGPINTTNLGFSFGASQATFSAYFHSANTLVL